MNKLLLIFILLLPSIAYSGGVQNEVFVVDSDGLNGRLVPLADLSDLVNFKTYITSNAMPTPSYSGSMWTWCGSSWSFTTPNYATTSATNTTPSTLGGVSYTGYATVSTTQTMTPAAVFASSMNTIAGTYGLRGSSNALVTDALTISGVQTHSASMTVTNTSGLQTYALQITDDKWRISTSSQIGHAKSPTAAFGDIRIGTISGVWYLFVSTAANSWSRVILSGGW